ncbi:MAG: hypothetical protein C4532_17010 [Candidatus Abyssobacteria bacterium SURF_17]|uniref:Uncharacterized protein n=1 Tax=Candidatus Abyssobacteria bacterium SURF_17 TaxID=2093361 RepID=A0A419ER55_9BACT|nr:MAG: hypothetical protein C4532_17010 [Candidatus Abyssubacteria bacterium SURF_17]
MGERKRADGSLLFERFSCLHSEMPASRLTMNRHIRPFREHSIVGRRNNLRICRVENEFLTFAGDG